MVGIKRSHASSFDNSLVPPTHFQVSPVFSNFSRPHKSSPNDNHISASYYTSSNSECYREVKWGSPCRYKCRKLNSENKGGLSHPNFPSFSGHAATVPSLPIPMFQRQLCKSDVLPNQVSEDRMEDSYQRSDQSSSGSNHRPFYSFLEVMEEGKKTTLGSNLEGCDVGNDGIDLRLKL